jgi:hypothetical protein
MASGGFLAGMIRLLHWLLLFGAFAGLGLRASGAHFDGCSEQKHAVQEVSCCGDTDAAPADRTDGHCPDCPPTPHRHAPHHHGECCHAPLWLPLGDTGEAMYPPLDGVTGANRSNEKPPEAPVMPLDKPPLI